MMAIMIYFRYEQIKVDNEIDEFLITPADYTVIVKNIPRGLNINYEKEVKQKFEQSEVDGKKLEVEKVVLVFETKSIEVIEKKIEDVINEKKKIIIENNYNFTHPDVLKIDEDIEHLEHQISQEKQNIIKNPDKFFAGTAFVSFSSEDMK